MLKRILFFAVIGVAARWFLWPMIFKESAADSFAIKELQGRMKAGFVEVSPDWDRFLKEWDDSASKTRRIAVARSIADYASFAELATVYRMRAHLSARRQRSQAERDLRRHHQQSPRPWPR